MQRILIIVGPTASGKSDLGVSLAERLRGEIISADSRQVYRGLDIGSGKITPTEMRGIPHHLLDVASPRRTFTAHDFVRKASVAITEIAARGKLPLIVGGTGFYIDALTGRVSLAAAPRDSELRRRLSTKSAEELMDILTERDARRAAAIRTKREERNTHRIIRAIEAAGKSAPPPEVRYHTRWIGIRPPDDVLKARIISRLASRLSHGMVEEANQLHAGGLSFTRMESLGLEYRYLARFLRGAITSEELHKELAAKIWQYARRQITYWKRNPDITWLPWGDAAAMVSQAEIVARN